ncbi:DUF6538 domain-containing protein [Swaminathania salitolerans]|uniref:DUF6538 domain-containing protein n=1 Tax=Swaminathania salitolerans TaxID=182838 RepID=UPI001FEC00E7|nr:DUF6538 domain-containing protein [Swaminathania salitolerans]
MERLSGLDGAKCRFAPLSFPIEGLFMLCIRGTTYHFRRIVRPALRPVLDKREIWVSLRTGYQLEARKRASVLHARTTELFEQAGLVSGLRRNAREFVALRETLATLGGLVPSQADGSETADKTTARRRMPAVDDTSSSVRKSSNKPRTASSRAAKTFPLPSMLPESRRPPSPRSQSRSKSLPPHPRSLLMTTALQQFVLDNPRASADTRNGASRAVSLFVEAYGDTPVALIGGETAGAFRDLLFFPSGFPWQTQGTRQYRGKPARRETQTPPY